MEHFPKKKKGVDTLWVENFLPLLTMKKELVLFLISARATEETGEKMNDNS